MTSFVTPAIDDKKWIDALETIFTDLIDHRETGERRIILEGFSGIYVRLEEVAGQDHTMREPTGTARQKCNVVNLEAYKPAQHRKKARDQISSELK